MKALRATLEGVTFVLKKTCEELLSVWRDRRAAPQALLQPRAQWENLAIQPDPFTGFHPGSVAIKPNQVRTSPQDTLRMVAAALDTNNRARWRTFSGT